MKTLRPFLLLSPFTLFTTSLFAQGGLESCERCAVQIREVGIDWRTNIISFETPLSFPTGNQSCQARASHPPETSLA